MSGRGHNKLPTTERIVKGEGPGAARAPPGCAGGAWWRGGTLLGWREEGGVVWGGGIPGLRESWWGGGVCCGGAPLLRESHGGGGQVAGGTSCLAGATAEELAGAALLGGDISVRRGAGGAPALRGHFREI